MFDPLRSQRLKSIIDRFLAVIGLLVTLPIFLAVAIILKIQRESVFFTQERVGLNLKIFKIFKFTTMVKGSEKYGTITTANDLRVTLLGKVLRRFKLNEIPQLINVLKGEMSFVGPRPLTPEEIEACYPPAVRGKIYSVKPGITGYGSLVFSNEDEHLENIDDVERYFTEVIMPKKAQLEIYYVNHWSILLDSKLFFQTIFKLLKDFGRYFGSHFLDLFGRPGVNQPPNIKPSREKR